MDKLGGTCTVLLFNHADMGVNSKAFHTSLAGHTRERHQWAGGNHSVVGTHLRCQRRKMRGGNFDDYRDNEVFVAVPFTSTCQKISGCI